MLEAIQEQISSLDPLLVFVTLIIIILLVFFLFASRFLVIKKKDDRPEALRRLDKATKDIKDRLKNGELSAQSKIPEELKEAGSLADQEKYDEVNKKLDHIEEQLGTSYEAGPQEEEVI